MHEGFHCTVNAARGRKIEEKGGRERPISGALWGQS